MSTAPNAPSPKLLTSPILGRLDLLVWFVCELLSDWLALELVFYFLTRLVCTTELPKIKLATRTAPAFSYFDDFLMAYHSCVYLVCLYVIC